MSRRAAVGLLLIATLSLTVLVLLSQGKDRSEHSAGAGRDDGPFRGGTLPRGLDRKQAPRFHLADARGTVIASRALRGRPYVLTFLYTDCRDVCPLIGKEVGTALQLLGEQRRNVVAVAVSVDPEHDTRATVRAWLRRLRLPANFHYLLGSRERLEPIWRAYFAAPQPTGIRESRHTASIWLVDAQGRLRTKFSGGIPVRPRDIAHDLRLLVREARRSG